MSAVQPYPNTDGSGVVRITINFTLSQECKGVVLRLARAGDETTVVTVDGKRTHLVTNSMLGNDDGYVAGVYNLKIGSLIKDIHAIQLAVADDGKGNGRHSWDALTLCGINRTLMMNC